MRGDFDTPQRQRLAVADHAQPRDRRPGAPIGQLRIIIRHRARAIARGEDWARFTQRFNAAYDNWTRGDAEAARRMEIAEAEKISRGFAARLFQGREAQWLSLIAERCDAAAIDCAIAVGFAHLGGEDGLLKGLERMGYRLVRGTS